MEIRVVAEDKKRFLDLLLLADEQESMVDRYLERGTLFALYDGGLKSVCVVTDEGEGVAEIKNLATAPDCQRQGYGRRLVEHVCRCCQGAYHTMQVGTGAGTATVAFYEKCGFVQSHLVRNFFTEHYDHPIVEDGVQLVDMVYLRKEL